MGIWVGIYILMEKSIHLILWEILQLSSHYFIVTLIRIMCYFHWCCTSLYSWCWRWFCFIIVTNKHFAIDSQILKGRCLFILFKMMIRKWYHFFITRYCKIDGSVLSVRQFSGCQYNWFMRLRGPEMCTQRCV